MLGQLYFIHDSQLWNNIWLNTQYWYFFVCNIGYKCLCVWDLEICNVFKHNMYIRRGSADYVKLLAPVVWSPLSDVSCAEGFGVFCGRVFGGVCLCCHSLFLFCSFGCFWCWWLWFWHLSLQCSRWYWFSLDCLSGFKQHYLMCVLRRFFEWWAHMHH